MSTIKAWMMAHRVISGIVVIGAASAAVAAIVLATQGDDTSDGATRTASATTRRG
jgi:hypothetical protein